MPVSESRMLQGIYDALFAAFTDPPPGAARQGGSQADSTFLTLNWPGLQVDVDQFANPASAANPGGSMAAVENLSTLVDQVPSLNPIHSPNGNTVSGIYEAVVNATVVSPPPDPARREAYDEAHAFLTARGTEIDESGNPIKVEVDSPVYATYKRKLKAYDAAVMDLMARYFALDMSKPEDQRQWSLLGPTYQDAVRSAHADLERAHQRRVEDALATLSQAAENQVGVLFRDARIQFDALRRASVTDPGRSYRPSYASPANWIAKSAAAEWTEMTIESGRERTRERSDFEKGSVGFKAQLGLWSVGPDFDAETSHERTDSTTDKLTVSFRFARVDIVRPWLNFLLFSVGGWSTPAFPPGSLSNGTKDQPAGTPFPLLPGSFIAVRDVRVSGRWGSKDKELIETKLGSSLRLGYGPFAVSGKFEHGSTDKSFTSEFDGTTITNSGLQIIGWVNTVVPSSPPVVVAAERDAVPAGPVA